MTIEVKFKRSEEYIYYDSFEELSELDNYNDIIYLNCNFNNLTSLPTLPSSLVELDCWKNNTISENIDKYFKRDWKKYREFQHSIFKKFANKIGNWFLECKYNPKYKYCQRRLTKEYDELSGIV